MSKGKVLITGGAGFIGSHLADRLLTTGYRVRVLDALVPQVHSKGRAEYLSNEVELIVGDIRDPAAVHRALEATDAVFHLAAAVGVGQSTYEAVAYSSVNVIGTATLLEALLKGSARPGRIVVASSMSVYGEGLYSCPTCGAQAPRLRPSEQLANHDWDLKCPVCTLPMEPQPTPETKPLAPTSVYAINKRDQEEMCLVIGRTVGIPTVALRFFNVYGDRQALSNPYTGVAAIFSSALLNGQSPGVFEDGLQPRDFVHVSDVVEACILALERTDVADAAVNIGTGQFTSLLQLLTLLKREIPEGREVQPKILGRFREGDIRACYADISRARKTLGFVPKVSLSDGIRSLARWVRLQASEYAGTAALDELVRFRLVE